MQKNCHKQASSNIKGTIVTLDDYTCMDLTHALPHRHERLKNSGITIEHHYS